MSTTVGPLLGVRRSPLPRAVKRLRADLEVPAMISTAPACEVRTESSSNLFLRSDLGPAPGPPAHNSANSPICTKLRTVHSP